MQEFWEEWEKTTLLRPRLRRTAVITAITMFFLVSLVLGLDLLFLITFSLAVIMGLAYFWGTWTLRSLQLEVISTPEAVEGQESPLSFRLKNKGRLTRYLVELEVPLPDGVKPLETPRIIFGHLPPKSGAEGQLRVRFQRRGLHRIGQGILWAQDPLGLFIVHRPCQLEVSVLVYPRPEPLELEPKGIKQDPTWSETIIPFSLPIVGGEEFWGVREYQPGDELRRVHWKVTAHRGALAVVETLPSRQRGITLVLDRHPESHRPLDGETTLDQLVRYAAFLVREWVRMGQKVTFWAPPDPPITVVSDWHEIWRFLALVETKPFPLAVLQGQGPGVILTTRSSPLSFASPYRQGIDWQIVTPVG